ncbi:MAG: type IV pilin [Desulfurococcales archaeon]|nr:type IV pilin [Desulfurococcales archaeon]
MWKAVSPLIATVILIAVTIAIAAIVIAWVYGIIGPTTATPEKLQIYPDARLVNMTSGATVFNVTVKNAGGVAISLSKVYLRENTSCVATSFIGSVSSGPGYLFSYGTTTSSSLPVGQVANLTAVFSCSVSPGATYTVVIVTQSGQAYYVTVTAEQGS